MSKAFTAPTSHEPPTRTTRMPAYIEVEGSAAGITSSYFRSCSHRTEYELHDLSTTMRRISCDSREPALSSSDQPRDKMRLSS